MIIVVTHWRVLKLITGEDFEVAEVKKFGNLWLIRHPETSLNAGNCLRGHIDIGLNSKGEQQMIDICEFFVDKGVVAVYSSDLKRASTAAYCLTNFWTLPEIPLFLTKDLRPVDLGDMTGLPIDNKVIKQLEEIDAAGDEGEFPGGETVKEFKDRIHRVFNYLKDK